MSRNENSSYVECLQLLFIRSSIASVQDTYFTFVRPHYLLLVYYSLPERLLYKFDPRLSLGVVSLHLTFVFFSMRLRILFFSDPLKFLSSGHSDLNSLTTPFIMYLKILKHLVPFFNSKIRLLFGV